MTTPIGGRRGRWRERDGTVTEDAAYVLTSNTLKLAIIQRPAPLVSGPSPPRDTTKANTGPPGTAWDRACRPIERWRLPPSSPSRDLLRSRAAEMIADGSVNHGHVAIPPAS